MTRLLHIINFRFYFCLQWLRLFFTFRKSITVHSVKVFDQIYLSNQFQILSWDVEKYLYVEINGVKIISKENFIVLREKVKSPIAVKFIGWHKTESILLQVNEPLVNIQIPTPVFLNPLRFKLIKTFNVSLQDKKLSFYNLSYKPKIAKFKIKITTPKIIIPSFNLKQNYE
jgi:hypothetical protein